MFSKKDHGTGEISEKCIVTMIFTSPISFFKIAFRI